MFTHNMANLITTLLEKPFKKLGLDFIGPVKPRIVILATSTF